MSYRLKVNSLQTGKMINIPVGFKKRHYPKFVPDSRPVIRLTNAHFIDVMRLPFLGNITVFRKGNLYFYLSPTIGKRFSKKCSNKEAEIMKFTPINFEYHDS